MNRTRQRAATVQRMHLVQQSRFDQLAAELAQIVATLTDLQTRHDEIETTISNSQCNSNASIDDLRYQKAWIDQLQAQKDAMTKAIAETQQQRDQTMVRIRDQKSKLDGWELLIDQLESELQQEYQRREAGEADDNHLRRADSRKRK